MSLQHGARRLEKTRKSHVFKHDESDDEDDGQFFPLRSKLRETRDVHDRYTRDDKRHNIYSGCNDYEDSRVYGETSGNKSMGGRSGREIRDKPLVVGLKFVDVRKKQEPTTATTFVGIRAILNMVIDDLRENADDVIDDELLNSFSEFTKLKDRLVQREERRFQDNARQNKDQQIPAYQYKGAQEMPVSVDPKAVLTFKARSKKVVHITQFLTEKCKRRRQNMRTEFVPRAESKTLKTLELDTEEEDHPYLGILMEEWGSANMRLLNHLLLTGDLHRSNIESYLAYTTKIFEFAEIYEWSSVLNFDYIYRELQAEHKCQWGTFPPHMELQILTPKRPKANQTSVQSLKSQEYCRIFKAKGSCPFGADCRYSH